MGRFETLRQDDPTQGYPGLGALNAPQAGTGTKQIRRFMATCFQEVVNAGGLFPIVLLQLPTPWPQTGLSIDIERLEWWTDTGILYFGNPDFPIQSLGDQRLAPVFQVNPFQEAHESYLKPTMGNVVAPMDGGVFGQLTAPVTVIGNSSQIQKAMLLMPQEIFRNGQRGGSRAPFISIGLETSQRRQLVFQPDRDAGTFMLTMEWTEVLG